MSEKNETPILDEEWRKHVQEMHAKRREMVLGLLAEKTPGLIVLKVEGPGENEFADCRRMQEVLAAKGIKCGIEHAYQLWRRYSDGWCASWLTLPPEDEELLFDLLSALYDGELVKVETGGA